MSEWISVKDKLPELRIPVLVYLKNSELQVAIMSTSNNWYISDEWNNSFLHEYITHWMPLPSPPKS